MTTNPLVSCVIPTIDRPSLLCRALDSVYDQTYSNIEIIVVVSPPHDPTRDMLKTYENHNESLKPIYTDKTGISVARNIGIREATGDYVALLDDDDVWTTKKIQMQVPYMEKYSIVSCLLLKVTKNGTYKIIPPFIHDIDVNDLFFTIGIIDPASTIFRTREIKEVGGFDEGIRFDAIRDVALKIVDRYDSCYLLDLPLLLYDRKHDQKRYSEHKDNENLHQISKIYHRHKDKVKSEIARKTWVKIKYAHYREMEGFRRYKHLLSGLLSDYELVIMRGFNNEFSAITEPSITLPDY